MKTKIFTLIFILFSLLGIRNNIFAQASGDYVATTSGDYNTAANWSVSNGSGGYTGTAPSAPTTAINVWIPEGKIMTTAAQANAQNMNISGELNTGNFTVQLGTSSSTTVGNLTITASGKLRSPNATGGTVNSLNIYGNTITVDGQLGAATATNLTAYNASTNPDGGGGIRVYCMAVKAGETTTVTVSGSGKINVARFFVSTATTALAPQIVNINMDINILNNNSALTPAFGAFTNTGGSDRTININANTVVSFTGNQTKSSLHSERSANGALSSGNYTYNVYGTLDMKRGSIRLQTSSTSGNTKSTYLNVKSGGTLIVGDTIRLIQGLSSGQTCGVFPETGSTVKFGQATSATQFRNNIGAATPSFPAAFSHLTIDNAAGLNYPTAFTVNGTLTFTNGKIALGANNLTIGSTGSIAGASATNYIVTDGAGVLVQTVPATTLKAFPVGTGASYDPISVTPTTESVFAVKVGTTLPAVALSNYFYNEKVWNITPTTASSTLVALTPSEVTATATNHVIGHYVNDAYTNVAAVKSGNTYTATFTTFSPFVTGATDLGTGIDDVKNKLTISAIGNQLIVNGAIAGQAIVVYNAAGQQIKQALAANDKTILSLKSGLYLVKVNNQVMKVIL